MLLGSPEKKVETILQGAPIQYSYVKMLVILQNQAKRGVANSCYLDGVYNNMFRN